MECGDLLANRSKWDYLHWDRVYRTGGRGRPAMCPAVIDPADITLFESQGLAVEDVAVAAVVYTNGRKPRERAVRSVDNPGRAYFLMAVTLSQ